MPDISRRLFLAGCAALAPALYAIPRFTSYPFSLGVSSGDPLPDGFVLWTRLAPDPLHGGGMPDSAVEVEWQVAEDEAMRRVVQKGKTTASPALAHSVHVDVRGLRSHRPYWYRFKAGKEFSPIARSSTTPAPGDAQARFKFAFASCQNWEAGYWTAYDHMLADDPELVVHLGDYIYEGAARNHGVRRHNSGEIVSLTDYRNRHALYRTDPALQKMHAHCPWIVTWDDHEVDNNYAGIAPEDSQPRDAFLERRANAYQAYYEHMPLRLESFPHGANMQLYRTLRFGDLARFTVLDTRQYRTDQPCGDGARIDCQAAFDPQATMMGDRQEAWFKETLDRSDARWNIVANQVLMARIDMKPGSEEAYSMDQWSGYAVEQARIMQYLAERQPRNPVVITGDIHSNWVSDLAVDWKSDKTPAVATEFIGTSISSGGDGVDERPTTQSCYAENARLKMFNGRRGYVNVTLTPGQCQADYRVVPYVSRPGAPIQTHSSWIVENNRRGVQKA